VAGAGTAGAIGSGRRPPALASFRRLGLAFRLGVTGVAAALVALFVGLVVLLGSGARASVEKFGLGFLTGTSWDVPRGIFGAWPAVAGTLVVSGLALLFAVPVAFGVALFASEFAPRWLRSPLAYFIDLGAAIPSVVYGFWAVVVLVPFLETSVEPALGRASGGSVPFGGTPHGTDVLAAGVILAIMIVPTIAALAREALRGVPRDLREAALGLGATRWEATRLAVLGPATPGLAGAVVLGLGRAIGETIAVALVIGNIYRAPGSLFARGSTIPSWLVNGFLESFGLARSSLYELAALLLVISVLVNVGARLLVRRWERTGPVRRRSRAVAGAPAPTPPPSAAAPALSVPPWFARIHAGRRTRLRRRRWTHAVVAALVVGAVALAVWPLASLLETAVVGGGSAVVHPSFYTSTPPPACGVGQTDCPIGGIGPEIEGTLVMLGLAACVALPVGILGGIYLSEYGRNRFGRSVAFLVDVLVGVPTILVGIFVFTLFLNYDRLDDQSAFAGAAALGVVMVPIVVKATELALRTVPVSVREGALALGFPRHRVTLRVVLGSCRSALVTGVLLALMRAAGETAAVLLTAGTSIYWISNLRTPVGALAPFIYDALTVYTSPNYTTDAWGAALVLLVIMAAVSLAARLSVRGPDGTASG
jgi:phosphate transport system permease protein